MNFRKFFNPYWRELETFLDNYFGGEIKKAKQISPIASNSLKNLKSFMRGGKRLRGGLVSLGYSTSGKKNLKIALPLSASLEITHAAILIHDDIIDEDNTRHHQPTVHTQYKLYHENHYQVKDPLHYGESMAICVADVGFYLGVNLIVNSKIPTQNKLRAIGQLASSMTNTAYGELIDVDYEYHVNVSDSAIYKIHTLKTAFYTFIGPLKIGGIAAGMTDNQIKNFELYGLPIGIAFQLIDDILGMFGNEQKTGKSNASDIKEGKNTLLYTQALKKANLNQKKRLAALWGKREITANEIKEVKQIIKETGSLKYSTEKAKKLAKEAIKAIPKITKNKELQEVYTSLAEYIVQREK